MRLFDGQDRKTAEAVGAFLLGVFFAWALPADWFSYAFGGLIGLTVLCGMLTSGGAEEQEELNLGLKVLSFFTFGTSRPNAVVKDGKTLSLFGLFAACTIGLGVGIILLAAFYR